MVRTDDTAEERSEKVNSDQWGPGSDKQARDQVDGVKPSFGVSFFLLDGLSEVLCLLPGVSQQHKVGEYNDVEGCSHEEDQVDFQN